MTLTDYLVQVGLAALLITGAVCLAIPDAGVSAIPGVWPWLQ